MLLINVSPEVQKAGDAQKKRSSSEAVTHSKRAMLLLDQIKREKGVWWMPWQ